jgi:hypothetical protein
MSYIPDKLTVSFAADSEGLFGRQCPNAECKCYFKVNANDFQNFSGSKMYCVQCGTNEDRNNFFTMQQIEYMRSIVARIAMDAIGRELKQYEIKPDPNALISIGLSVMYDLPQIMTYVEKEIKMNILCSRCRRSYALYGISFFCPFCGERSSIDVFNENIISVSKLLELDQAMDSSTIESFTQAGLFTQITEAALKQCVTIFETYCKSKYIEKKFKLTPCLTKEDLLRKIGTSFQNIDRSHNLFLEFGFDLKSIFNQAELARLKIGFEKRHVLTHNSGIIDSRYVKKTNGVATEVGNRIIVTNNEVRAVIGYLQKIISKIETFF